MLGCVGAWVRGCVGAWVRGCIGVWEVTIEAGFLAHKLKPTYADAVTMQIFSAFRLDISLTKGANYQFIHNVT